MKPSKIVAQPIAQINVRIDRQLKEEGDAVLAEAGISPTQIVRDLWGKLARRGSSLEELVAVLGSGDRASEEQARIDAKLAVVDRVEQRRAELARSLGLKAADTPLYPDGYDWHERVQAEHDRKWARRGL